MKRFRWDEKYLYWGVTAFLVVVASILFFTFLDRWSYVRGHIGTVTAILTPFLWGLIFAYMLTPFARWTESIFAKIIKGSTPRGKIRAQKAHRALGIVFALSITLSFIAFLLISLLPQVYSSIETLVGNLEDYTTATMTFLQNTLDNIPALEIAAINIVEETENFLQAWFTETLLPNMDMIIVSVSVGLFGFFRALFNIVLALVLSIYILYNREIFAAQFKKAVYAILPEKKVLALFQGIAYTDRAFGQFFLARVLDSAIIGAICFIVLAILQMPYTALVSVIIGLTNIIPFFGPFIGGIPSALLILMESPVQGLIFIVFIIILQQIDGNIIGPKLLANTTGLSGFWVLFAILLGGGLFGFPGMIIGVPAFSLIYAWVSFLINRQLARKDKPIETTAYREERILPHKKTGGAKRRPSANKGQEE